MRYQQVVDEAELLTALSDPAAAILSGGTDLLVKIRGGVAAPETLLDIGRIPTLSGIRESNGSIEIGAATTETEILASSIVQETLPVLTTALAGLGSIQIRNRGTLGGNLANASPAADSAIPLLLYDAELDLVGPNGPRTVPLDGFFLGPGKTALEPGDYIRTIRVPIPEPGWCPFYHKVGKRRALTIAIASVGALIRIEGDRIVGVRFAAGSVAPTPIRLHAVEERIRSNALTEEVVDEARRLAMESVSPIDDVRATADYRRCVVGDLVARALRLAP